VERQESEAESKPSSIKRVITNSAIDRRFQILNVRTATGPGGFLKAQVEVQNRTSQPQSFIYVAEWLDEDGMTINLPTASAIPRTLEGKEVVFITATAPTERARDFRIKIFEPKS
jgi:uncharacterized protein YcfL